MTGLIIGAVLLGLILVICVLSLVYFSGDIEDEWSDWDD